MTVTATAGRTLLLEGVNLSEAINPVNINIAVIAIIFIVSSPVFFLLYYIS